MSSQPLRNSTTRWRRADTAHHLHPFTDYKALASEGSRIITAAQGVWLEDSEGARILDGMAGLWNVNVGYGRSELAEAAYKQMLDLPYYNTFFKTATPPAIELAEKLAQITPEGLDYVFFGSSGSESNDTVVRLVRYYWQLMDKPEKKTIISRTYAYHGSTMAGASLGGMAPMHAQTDMPLPHIEHVMAPYWYDFGEDLSPAEFGRKAAAAVEEKILELGADKVAAFIGEPVMGAGGVLIPPETYWPEVQRICEKHDVLMIVDEVICGFGRTGEWFASDHYGLKPDVMTLAKGITSGYQPLSAVMVGRRIAEALFEKGGEFFHGYTYSGHPVCCAVGLKNIEIMQREGLVEKVREETAPHLARRLKELEDHPLVGEVRSLGLLGAIELVKNKETRTRFEPEGHAGGLCRDHCFERNVILRAVRDVMVMSPPLVISTEEIDELLARTREALDATAKDLGAA
ncbi:MAG: aspartate aminotransferase family protein [Rhodovibrionaceae bacterium]|nr:aspartate aminotransferase family protein [Rhodovibrionaceae bacterium]